MPSDMAELFEKLTALGAGEFAHLNGTLQRHFIAVHDILRGWDADETLCRAGLFHAAYGTSGFTEAMISPAQRTEIIALIGADAEQIVYTYCSCDRDFVWPLIGTADHALFRNRFTGLVTELGGKELCDFCELTCANELEIAAGDRAFVDRAGNYLSRLFRTWGKHLSEPARQASMVLIPVI